MQYNIHTRDLHFRDNLTFGMGIYSLWYTSIRLIHNPYSTLRVSIW